MVRRQTTGLGLSEDEAFVGLVDYGLFSEKLPPCFTSEGLSDHVPYQVWREKTLSDEGQSFLAELKRNRFGFIRGPNKMPGVGPSACEQGRDQGTRRRHMDYMPTEGNAGPGRHSRATPAEYFVRDSKFLMTLSKQLD